MKKALVVSGGGAKGAFGGGIIDYLHSTGHKWDMFFGTSTGSLLITLTSIGDMIRMKEAYTSVNMDSIFSVNPFNKDGSINIPNAIWRLIRGKKSLGESGNLEKLIRKYFTEADYKKTLAERIPLFPCVTNYRTGQFEFGQSYEEHAGPDLRSERTYDNFVKYVLASTSVPLAMNLVDIDGNQYLDGGVMQHVPLQKAIDDGATEIDCIILRIENAPIENWQAKSLFDVLMRTTDLMESEISYSNVIVGKLLAGDHDVKINFFYTPRILCENSLIFNKEQMLAWWNEGYWYAMEQHKAEKIAIDNLELSTDGQEMINRKQIYKLAAGGAGAIKLQG